MNKTKLKVFLYGFWFLVINIFYANVFAGGSNETVLPIKLSEHGLPVASIQIQNHNIPLIFDTGADQVIVLSESVANQLHLKIILTTEEKCFGSHVGKTCMKTCIIPAVKIGSMIIRDVPCLLRDNTSDKNEEEYFGIEAGNGTIGLNFLRQFNFNLLIDYKNSYIILSKQGEYPSQYDIKNWNKLPFFNKYGITTNAKINNIDLVLGWDTGANSSAIKSTAKIAKSIKKKSCASQSDSHCQYFYTTTFMVGDIPMPKTKFYIIGENFPFDGLIGFSFFQEHPIFFDFKNDLLFIKP